MVEPFIGGSGGRNGADGIDGIDQPVAFLRSAPVETVELETDLLRAPLQLRARQRGAGPVRGGFGMRIELENRGLPATVTVRGMDRFRFQPWGVAGGAGGAPAGDDAAGSGGNTGGDRPHRRARDATGRGPAAC